ncbi:hypothetical protein [Halorubrum lipolyticum]|uniref:Uncharacterized protein n=1 Tax=Halorubrum lipolyticum DSM 21995 TaxID=1227482 RepID=M0NMC6_9EURY|nr:hypothetical protein [Halorubrum lipolyticum]EMA58941.1 hypothetical protein C469_12238 [Halorubrum lipolyticum DSM 21995]
MSTHNTPDDSTSTEPIKDLDDTNSDSDETPAPTYENPYKDTTNHLNAVSPDNPIGQLYSGDFEDVVRATHVAYGRYHGDVTEGTYTQTTTDTTNTETTDVVTEEFPTRSLHYHSELVTPDHAIDALKEMPPGYNDFRREAVVELVNNLAANTKIGVAREYSPAVYIWHNDLPKLADQISEHLTGNKYPDEIGVVDTGDTHTYPGRPSSDNLEDQQPNSPELVRMWWD